MTIAELFVNLGVKGGNTALKTLGGVKEGLSSITNASIEAKAGIVGVVYGLERLMQGVSQQGLALRQYGDYTQQSTEALQRWQVAFRQAGVSAEEVDSSLRHIHEIMGKLETGEGVPAGYGLFAAALGLTPDDEKRMFKDASYFLEKGKEFAKLNAGQISPGFTEAGKNQILKNLGFSENLIAGYKSKYLPDIEKITKGLVLNDKQIDSLARTSVAWQNFWARIRMDSAGFTAVGGQSVVHELNQILTTVEGLGKATGKLLEKIPILKEFKLGLAAVAGTGILFGPLTAALTGVLLFITKLEEHQKEKTGFWGAINSSVERFKNIVGDIYDDPNKEKLKDHGSPGGKLFVPPVVGPQLPQGSVIINQDIKQNIQHTGDAKDTHAVKDVHKMGVETAWNLMSAKYQVS